MGLVETYLREVMLEGKPGVRAGVLRALAAGAEGVYSAVVGARNTAYERGLLGSRGLGRPVISVGNLSAGGTGKTPVVAYLAGQLVQHDSKPAVLLRGYREVDGVSDEAAELASAVSEGHGDDRRWRVPVFANADRVRGAAAVLSERPETDVFILDDAMQHRRVRRELEVVLVSARQGLCGGRVLPRGMLRERVSGLGRADLVIVTRADQAQAEALAALEGEIAQWAPGKPVLRCTHGVVAVTTDGGERWSPEAVRGRRVFAVAGTGDPAAFLGTVSSLGAVLAGSRTFRDHHAYRAAEWAEVGREARAAGAEAVITTGKDWVKLAALGKPSGLDTWVVRIQATFSVEDGRRLVAAALGVVAGEKK